MYSSSHNDHTLGTVPTQNKNPTREYKLLSFFKIRDLELLNSYDYIFIFFKREFPIPEIRDKKNV